MGLGLVLVASLIIWGVFALVVYAKEKRSWWFSFTTTAASLKELRDRSPELFHPGNDWWFSQPFAKEHGQAGQKIQILTSGVPGSFIRDFAEQQEFLSEGEFVPTVRDVVDGMLAYYRNTGKRISSGYWVHCKDVSSDGNRIYLWVDSDGLHIHDRWEARHHSFGPGWAVARKSFILSS